LVRISSLKHIDYYSAIHGSIPLNYCFRRDHSAHSLGEVIAQVDVASSALDLGTYVVVLELLIDGHNLACWEHEACKRCELEGFHIWTYFFYYYVK